MNTATLRRELARRGTCPTCGDEYQRLAGHWRGPCSPPALSAGQRELVAGLLLGNGRISGNGTNKHFQLSTQWRPFAAWVYQKLGWLAARVVRLDDSCEDGEPHRKRGQDWEYAARDTAASAQQYLVRTHAHPGLTRFRAWYDEDGDRHLPTPDELPSGRLTRRAGQTWHATAGSLGWSNAEYATTRQAYFSAAGDDRAARVSALFKSVGLDPTRVGKGIKLPPKQATAWVDWIGPPVPGVAYKWAATPAEYQDTKRDAEAIRARLWYHPEAEKRITQEETVTETGAIAVSAAECADIRRRRRDGETVAAIADGLGRHERTVSLHSRGAGACDHNPTVVGAPIVGRTKSY